jgi:hypothetical protein
MTCADAHDALLVAAPDELHENTNSPLAAHLTSCARCAALARAIRMDCDSLRVRVRDRSARRARRRRVIGAVAFAGSTAAAIAIIAVRMSRTPATESVAATPSALAPSAGTVSVDVEPGQRATVIKTSDPKVTIVWMTPAEGL